MLNWNDFRHQIRGACVLISAETDVTCTVRDYPEQPHPGDHATIVVGSDTVIHDGEREIPIVVCEVDFDLFDLRSTSERIDVFAILHTEVVKRFYQENPEYAAWKTRQG